MRLKQSPVERKYETIRKKEKAREIRSGWNTVEHWLGKQKAKTKAKNDMSEWELFMNKSKSQKDLLTERYSYFVRGIDKKRR